MFPSVWQLCLNETAKNAKFLLAILFQYYLRSGPDLTFRLMITHYWDLPRKRDDGVSCSNSGTGSASALPKSALPKPSALTQLFLLMVITVDSW